MMPAALASTCEGHHTEQQTDHEHRGAMLGSELLDSDQRLVEAEIGQPRGQRHADGSRGGDSEIERCEETREDQVLRRRDQSGDAFADERPRHPLPCDLAVNLTFGGAICGQATFHSSDQS